MNEIGPAIFSPMKALNNLNWVLGSVQVTFSEKGTKITPQTHIQKFEILHFSDIISKDIIIQVRILMLWDQKYLKWMA